MNLLSNELKSLLQGAIILAQTDTTAGFLSISQEALNRAKNRPLNQPCIKTFASLKAAKCFTRLPQIAKNTARKARKTTIATGSKSLRIIKNHPHANLLAKLESVGICGIYSTSANEHTKRFNLAYALKMANFIELNNELIKFENPVINQEQALKDFAEFFKEESSSKLLKFSHLRAYKLR